MIEYSHDQLQPCSKYQFAFRIDIRRKNQSHTGWKIAGSRYKQWELCEMLNLPGSLSVIILQPNIKNPSLLEVLCLCSCPYMSDNT